MRIPLALLLGLAAAAAGAAPLRDFTARDLRGRTRSLYALKEARAVVLIAHATSCPILRKYYPALESLAREYEAKGVRFFYVSAAPQDDPAGIAKEYRDYGLKIPLLLDADQAVLRDSGLRVTSEVAVIDPRGWTKVYQGAVDDQNRYAVTRGRARRRYLKDALDALLSGAPVRVPRAAPAGCAITLKPAP
jgi:peroxiredoxin